MSKITQLNLDGALLEVKDPRFENDKFFQYNLGTISETPDISQNVNLQKIYDAAISGGSVMAIYDGILLDVSEISADKMVLSSSSGLTFLKINVTVTAGAVTEAVRISTTPIIYGETDYEDGVTPLPTGTIYCYYEGVTKEGLMFSSPNPFELKFAPSAAYTPTAKIEVSKNGLNWTQPVWDETNGISLVADESNSNGNYSVFIKSDDYINTSSKYSKFSIVSGTNIEVSGKLDAMWGGKEPAGYDAKSMFSGMAQLVNAKDLVLPATVATNMCYNMFYNCSSLVQGPTLPTTNVASSCYYNMFKNCTSLNQAIVLPVTTLEILCYLGMFQGCTSLTQAPELPATTLMRSCYNSMFKGCTSLTQAPELPATTLADSCYGSMFYGCTSLTQAPELPATTLAEKCYDKMFQDCTSLTQAPAILPATTLTDYCYQGMFQGCTSLTKPVAFPTINNIPIVSSGQMLVHMFDGCSSIKWGASGTPYKIKTTDGTVASTAHLIDMFKGNSGSIPEGNGYPKLNTTYYYIE